MKYLLQVQEGKDYKELILPHIYFHYETSNNKIKGKLQIFITEYCHSTKIINFSFDGAQQSAIHHYSKSFRGFSAMLTPEQAQQLAGT